MNLITDECEQIIADSPALNAGPFGLWLRVFFMSIREIQQGGNDRAARGFIYDKDNDFLLWVLEELGIDHAALMERLDKRQD